MLVDVAGLTHAVLRADPPQQAVAPHARALCCATRVLVGWAMHCSPFHPAVAMGCPGSLTIPVPP
eukprot:9953912-Alexandrium_andersonii.AAC.1